MAEKIDYSKGIYDAKQLGTPKLLILGAQHMFAMFGATVLVPLLTGLSVSTTLLCAPAWRCGIPTAPTCWKRAASSFRIRRRLC